VVTLNQLRHCLARLFARSGQPLPSGTSNHTARLGRLASSHNHESCCLCTSPLRITNRYPNTSSSRRQPGRMFRNLVALVVCVKRMLSWNVGCLMIVTIGRLARYRFDGPFARRRCAVFIPNVLGSAKTEEAAGKPAASIPALS